MRNADAYIKIHRAESEYRPRYHLAAPYGWINDPNGFIFFGGEWHLFYQYNPYSCKWGRMHWGHAKSKNLCDWTHIPVALSPDHKGDRFLGCFSGSAVEKDGKLFLMYTGVPFCKQHQMLAESADGIEFVKSPRPVIPVSKRPPGAGRFAFRDPKILAADGVYYAVIGASEGKGRQIALYSSTDLKNWKYTGSLKREKRSKGIFECPDLARTPNGDILIYSVMYTKQKGSDFQNLHSSVYELGKADLSSACFESNCAPRELDHGADFYAPQTAKAPDGRIIMTAWMQMWFRSIPTQYLKQGFAGMLILPRELEVRDSVLYQRPAREVYRMFGKSTALSLQIKDEISIDGLLGETYLLKLKIKSSDKLKLKLRKGERCFTEVTFGDGLVVFDRTNGGHPIKGRERDCNLRKMEIAPSETIEAEIFSDKSSVEIFVNGRHCMANTVYPFADAREITFASEGGCAAEIEFRPYRGGIGIM